MYLELHLLQNFAPSNLNRDDTGSPKECVFGGVSRARISSQCLKRSIRQSAEFRRVLAGHEAVRTRRLIVEVAERLSGKRPAPESVTKVIAEVYKEAGLERPEQRGAASKGQGGADSAEAQAAPEEKDNTKLLLFMDARGIDEAVAVFRARWEALGDKAQREAAIVELGNSLVGSARVPDVALFGRMIEMDNKTPFGRLQLGVEGATQVAHAISTHQVTGDEDFYTAVDDLLHGETGAGMMGTVFYNSACYYRYANVDHDQLTKNLGGDRELAARTAEAFVRGAIKAIPTGKQTSMAAQNPPSLVMAVVRDDGLWSLANAFERPVRPTEAGGVVEPSIVALDGQWGKLSGMYGVGGIRGVWLVEAEDARLEQLGGNRVASVDELIARVRDTLRVGVVA